LPYIKKDRPAQVLNNKSVKNEREHKMKINNCKLIEKKLIFYIDNELNVNESALVKAHLEKCPSCQCLLNQLGECLNLIEEDKLKETNPFFQARLMEKIKSQDKKLPVWSWIPKKQLAFQFTIYILLGFFALLAGIYLGSGNTVVDESSLIEQIDTTDYELFANSYNYNFNQNIYQVELDKTEDK